MARGGGGCRVDGGGAGGVHVVERRRAVAGVRGGAHVVVEGRVAGGDARRKKGPAGAAEYAGHDGAEEDTRGDGGGFAGNLGRAPPVRGGCSEDARMRKKRPRRISMPQIGLQYRL